MKKALYSSEKLEIEYVNSLDESQALVSRGKEKPYRRRNQGDGEDRVKGQGWQHLLVPIF